MFKQMFEGLSEDSLAQAAITKTLNFISSERSLKSENKSVSSQSISPSKTSTPAVYSAKEDSVFEDPEASGVTLSDDPDAEGINLPDDPDAENSTGEEIGDLLLELGISKEDWEVLTEKEKQKIKDCN